MTHSNVALYVEGRGSCEPEGLHVREYLGLEESALRPGTTESADQFIVDRTSVLIYQLDPLVASVMGVAVVHHDIETVWCRRIEGY